jgi:hypothetical protein
MSHMMIEMRHALATKEVSYEDSYRGSYESSWGSSYDSYEN